jgi:hypothetical protein
LTGNLKYSYDEQIGTEFDMESIAAATKLVTEGSPSKAAVVEEL